MKLSNTQKPIILNPGDSMSDIIYQIKSDVNKNTSTSVYIPEQMYMLYNKVNLVLFAYTVQQLLEGGSKINLFSSDLDLIRLFTVQDLEVGTVDGLPQPGSDVISDDYDPFTAFFSYDQTSNHVDNFSPVNLNSYNSLSPEPIFQTDPNSPNSFFNNSKPKYLNSHLIWGLTLFLIISIVSLVIFIPKAEVVITPKIEKLSKDFDITFDPNITDVSAENRLIPSNIETISVSVDGTYEATGSQVGGSKATATVNMINNTSAPQQLVTNTRLRSDGGKQFRLGETINIPANGSVSAKIIADAPGPEYNIKSGKLTIPGLESDPNKFSNIYGNLEEAINNGATEDGTVVTEQDLSKARLDLQQKITEVVNNQVSERKDSKALSIQSKLNDIDYSGLPNVGDRVRSFNVKATSSLDGIFYKEEDLNGLIKTLLSTQVLDSKDLKSDFNINFDNPQEFPSKKALKSRVYVEYNIQNKFDKNNIANNLRLRTVSRAKNYLQDLENVDKVSLKLTPGFSPILPVLGSRIDIKVE